MKTVRGATSITLSDRLCFDLYAAARAVTRAYGPHLAGLGLTYPQYLVMLTLWQRSPRTVKELGENLDLDSGTLSPLLKRLEASGLVTRRRHPDDERTVEIDPTPEGRALLRDAARVPSAMAPTMGISAQEARNLRVVLRKLTTSIGRYAGEAGESIDVIGPRRPAARSPPERSRRPRSTDGRPSAISA